MKQAKQVINWYVSTLPFAGAITLGFDMADAKRMELAEGMDFKERSLKISKDVALAMIWPVTAPAAIKKFSDNFDGPSYD